MPGSCLIDIQIGRVRPQLEWDGAGIGWHLRGLPRIAPPQAHARDFPVERYSPLVGPRAPLNLIGISHFPDSGPEVLIILSLDPASLDLDPPGPSSSPHYPLGRDVSGFVEPSLALVLCALALGAPGHGPCTEHLPPSQVFAHGRGRLDGSPALSSSSVHRPEPAVQVDAPIAGAGGFFYIGH